MANWARSARRDFGFFRCSPAAFPSNGIGVSKNLFGQEVLRVLVENNQVRGNTGTGIAIGRFGFRGTARQNRIIGNVATGNGGSSPHNDFADRYDILDSSESGGLSGAAFDCDENVYRNNVFETAFPACVYEQQGLTPPPALAPAPSDPGGIQPV